MLILREILKLLKAHFNLAFYINQNNILSLTSTSIIILAMISALVQRTTISAGLLDAAHHSIIAASTRSISTTTPVSGKKNFRKFLLYNKRGPRIFKAQQRLKPDPELPIDKRGVRDSGFSYNGAFVEVPQMIPQLVVPNLASFKLKPYVSYKMPEVLQSEFTSQDMFDAVYSKKIVEDFKSGRLTASGDAIDPSAEERLTEEEAWSRARRTGSDIF